jgi:hypothetical protein
LLLDLKPEQVLRFREQASTLSWGASGRRHPAFLSHGSRCCPCPGLYRSITERNTRLCLKGVTTSRSHWTDWRGARL